MMKTREGGFSHPPVPPFPPNTNDPIHYIIMNWVGLLGGGGRGIVVRSGKGANQASPTLFLPSGLHKES